MFYNKEKIIKGDKKMKIENLISKIELGDLQTFENISILPLFMEISNIPGYISLASALNTEKFIIQEVDEYGDVPTLKVINKLNEDVFMMEGEELKGGKQNRVLNTSILVEKNSTLDIPVSCTERGRWHYTSSRHEDPVVIPSKLRNINNMLVFTRLCTEERYVSDQNLIWEEVDRYSNKFRIKSKTSALRDVYENLKENLDKNLKNFPILENQKGLIVFINGKLKGMDLISLSSVYKDLHEKIIKSYLIDIFEEKKTFKENYHEDIKNFFDEIVNCEILKFKSVGLGWDYRLKGKNVMGSILMYNDMPVHVHIFKV